MNAISSQSWLRFRLRGRCVAALLSSASLLIAQTAPRSGITLDKWWRHAVIYQIYPRSFQDSNGDGIGDLNGVTSRLDYLQSLGVDAIWLNPIYPSPQVDFGYDISDYEAIDPQYGTLQDFDRLVIEARRRHIRVIMDLVLNHTSDQHPWFIQSKSSKDNATSNWYVWADGKDGGPPNNWRGGFGGPAWQYDATRKQFYYHMFYPQQPDLNWRNPAVRKAMYDVVRFWLNRGVAGFRLDAIHTLFEDPSLKDAVMLDGVNDYGDRKQDRSLTINLPEVHDVLREVRKVTNEYPGQRVLIGEVSLKNVQDLALMYGRNHDELQLPMDSRVGLINKLDVTAFRERIDEAETQIDNNQPLFFLDNHDGARSWDRYGDGVHNAAIARVMATVLMATRATTLLYYGQELGMVTTPPARREDVKDPLGIAGWPKQKGRDGERTPMQWVPSATAGFTTGRPWLPIPPSVATVNVESESKDPSSLLAWYKQLLQLRRKNITMREGTNVMINHDVDNVLVWLRKPLAHSANGTNARPLMVFCNFSAEPKTISVVNDLEKYQIRGSSMRTLLRSDVGVGAMFPATVRLPPFGVYIGEVER